MIIIVTVIVIRIIIYIYIYIYVLGSVVPPDLVTVHGVGARHPCGGGTCIV